uniref:DNA repair endonuclease XPF n=1 Tax=Timema douglasi TaxID=61478 RepID=A0A7R8VSR5_TIMDO|nr:unnamed protein product [Timema douglasi]
MLEYENQMFLDILHQDGLVIAAKGLGVESVFLSLLKVYSDPGNLVVVLGTTGKEEEFYLSQLEAEGVKCLPKVITNEYNSSEREMVYLEGGVLFMSSRILVVDLLKDRVPVANITGFLVCRAHSILESCQEAFALRLYRQKNKTGFVKAFSNSAQAFTVGFAQVERIMRTLFVKNLYLWPRFHATVHSSLEKLKPSVVELHLEMTPAMLQIQTALLDLMNFTVKEMRRVNPSLDMDDLTVENAISKSFHKVLQLQLDPIWHQLSSKTKQLVADLRTLSHILVSLSRYDCVTFNTQLSSLRNMDYVIKNSGWMLLDAAETLFLVAKQRVLGRPREKTDPDKEKNKTDPDKEKGIELLDVDPEPSPKWMALTEVLKEINVTAKVKLEGSTGGTDKLLILVEDNRICEQIKQYLTLGAKAMLLRLYERAFNCRVRPAPAPVPQEKVEGEEEEEDGEMKESYTLSQRPASDDANDIKLEVVDTMELKFENITTRVTGLLVAFKPEKEESCSIDAQPPMIVIHTFKKYGDPLALSRTLREVRPRFVLMYDADMAAVRRLEVGTRRNLLFYTMKRQLNSSVYQSEHSEFQFQVFFLMYGGSVEEQAYLTSLRREKEAFDYLIKQKASMVVPEDQDGLSEDCSELSRDASKPDMAAGSNTRKGGHPARPQTTTVIVDMREFRSELPALIHKRGIEIEPVTLQVGDYILTPEICVERKSVSDLIGSLNSGRLYNQALAMTRYYAKPMLLIEFDQNKPFALQGRFYVSNDVSSNDVTSKLQLLTLHFPKLRIVWSPSPYATAQLFEELKQGRAQPEAAAAAAVGAELEQQLLDVSDNSRAQYDTREELSGLVNNGTEAQSLYDALHKVYQPSQDSGPSSRGGRGGKFRGRGFKRRKN